MTVRIVAFMDTQLVSGPARQLAALIPQLHAHGIEITVLAVLHIDDADSEFTRFLASRDIPFVVAKTPGRLTAGFINTVGRVIESLRPDIVQTHSYRPAFIAWRLKRRGAKWPWVAFFHGYTSENLRVRFNNFVDRVVLHFADALVVVATAQKIRFPLRRDVVQIPNAVLPAIADVADASLRSAIEQTARPRIGFIGRLSREKGLDILLEAVGALRQEGMRCSVIIAGDGPERSVLEAQCESAGLRDSVLFLGAINAVAAVYEASDVFVLPSRTEGMPNVLLEAARFDVPMVSTTVGEIPTILVDADAGILVPPTDSKALASAIRQSIAGGRTTAGRAAREAIARRYSLDARVRAHLELYASVGATHVA